MIIQQSQTPVNTSRPPVYHFHPENIPAELRAIDRWVCWAWRRTGAKWDKPPINPATGLSTSALAPKNWLAVDAATGQVKAGRADGPGLAFVEGDDYSGTDLDDCRDPDTGVIDAWAQVIIDEIDSYTEVSPSGRGIKIFTRGDFPLSGRPDGGRIEMYTTGRYFTVTGCHLPGTPTTVNRRPRQLQALNARIFARKEPATSIAPAVTIWPAPGDDVETARRCLELLGADRCDNYDQWIDVGMALQGTLGDAGLVLWDSWSSRSTKYKAGECEHKWRSFDGDGLKMGSLVMWAREDSGSDPSPKALTVHVTGHNGNGHESTANFDVTPLISDVARFDQLHARIAELEAENTRLRADLQREREARTGLLAIIRNGDLGPRRMALAATVNHVESCLRTGEVDERGRVEVNLGTIGTRSGCKGPAVSAALEFAESLGLLRRSYGWQSVLRPDGSTFAGRVLLVEPVLPITEAMTFLANYQRAEPEMRGGKRERRCPDHPTAKLIHAEKWICTKCGQVVDECQHEVRSDPIDEATLSTADEQPETRCFDDIGSGYPLIPAKHIVAITSPALDADTFDAVMASKAPPEPTIAGHVELTSNFDVHSPTRREYQVGDVVYYQNYLGREVGPLSVVSTSPSPAGAYLRLDGFKVPVPDHDCRLVAEAER